MSQREVVWILLRAVLIAAGSKTGPAFQPLRRLLPPGVDIGVQAIARSNSPGRRRPWSRSGSMAAEPIRTSVPVVVQFLPAVDQ
jgi:hypothetical protein